MPQPQAATNHIEYKLVIVEDARPKKDEAMDVDDLAAMLEAVPGGNEEMAAARQWLGNTLEESEQGTLKSLRLAVGLSQAALAQSVGLQQPNISAIEAGKRRPEYETARKLAGSLNVSVADVYAAFDRSAQDQ